MLSAALLFLYSHHAFRPPCICSTFLLPQTIKACLTWSRAQGCGTIGLSAGMHAVTVYYYENSGDAVLEVRICPSRIPGPRAQNTIISMPWCTHAITEADASSIIVYSIHQ